MRASRTLIPVLAVLLAVVGYNSLFRVEQWQQAIVFQFREIDRVKSKLDNHTGGSHSRMPNEHPLQPFRAKGVKGHQASCTHLGSDCCSHHRSPHPPAFSVLNV